MGHWDEPLEISFEGNYPSGETRQPGDDRNARRASVRAHAITGLLSRTSGHVAARSAAVNGFCSGAVGD